MKFAAITGMLSEARVARRAGIEALPSGGVPANTKAIAERFIRDGAELLVSFGIAGALSPSLKPGSLLLPSEVIDEAGNCYPVDAKALAYAREKLLGVGQLESRNYSIFGASNSASTIDGKKRLFLEKQSIAVDLESHIVASIATRSGVPFLVLRTVADPADRALPPAAVNGLGPDGKPALGPVLRAVVRDPRQIPSLIQLARYTNRALAALSSALAVKPFEGGAR